MAELEVKLKTIAVGKLCVCAATDGSGNAIICEVIRQEREHVIVIRLGSTVEKEICADTLVQPFDPAQGNWLRHQLAKLKQFEEEKARKQDELLRKR